jgi:hypothetical protein
MSKEKNNENINEETAKAEAELCVIQMELVDNLRLNDNLAGNIDEKELELLEKEVLFIIRKIQIRNIILIFRI